MNKGSKITLVIPSAIAYKDQGVGPIGPYTPIIFEMEMVEIVKPNPNAPKPVEPQMQMQQAPSQSQPTQK
jgi:hypothetical protein